jgi:hypothetical protein
MSLVMQYADGYTAVVQGEDLYATATFPLALDHCDAEFQALRELSLVPSAFETRKLVLEVDLVPGGKPVLRVQCAVADEGPPIPSA